jgi:gamma-glutamyl hercynylcysteine S-oxide synthase
MTGTAVSGRVDPGAIAAQLQEARARTFLLVAPLSDADLRLQHDPLMSPIIWDLGHIAHFEELWLTRNLDGPIEFVEMPGLYNPFEHPRSTRGALELPGIADCRAVMDEIRGHVLGRLASTSFDPDHPLLHAGFVYNMVLQHEYQHNETILQTLQLKQGTPYTPLARLAPPSPSPDASRRDQGEMVLFPGGSVEIGTDDRACAYDNERPRHLVDVSPFLIDVNPITNGEFLRFIAEGGYETPDWWSEAGWRWRQESGAVAPKYWSKVDGAWITRSMDREGPVANDHPVCHVSYHEAEAFARFVGKRLPTEIEWEAAASWEPTAHVRRTYPWGETPPDRTLANLDQLSFGTAAVGAYPLNVSAIGCRGMIGDVWEWTSSDFGPWPGFQSFPYKEYSELFFGTEYKVLRGGSWATRPGAVRNTFRNWDYPIRRQIFSGFRCARNV